MYVDDLLIIENDAREVKTMKTETENALALLDQFEMMDCNIFSALIETNFKFEVRCKEKTRMS